ncbi:MAG: EAL domain-containing protein [Acidaminococcaceae bacterium]|nr:EAL domain-containing protein [Acidaminococcaceae bacterium]MBR1590258.1 EAL domain-containing protein [Acidaminococcaceae bacterium]
MKRDLENYIMRNYKKAIESCHIQVYYQPVIRTFSRKLCSFEALARWIDPEIGTIYPDEFIPVLERERVINHLDTAILRQVCERIRNSVVNGEIPIPVSVNLSRLDFTLCDIFSVADRIISKYQIPHDFIYFEITESLMAEKEDLLKEIVERFRSAGYQIWMDDFGSGYSSLNVLKELSFDELKLDMRFLRPFSQRSQRIATAVVEMAKNIDIHTLVEGVETEEQFSFLRNIGCEKVQGYYFGKPMPYEEALARMTELGIEIETPQDRLYYDNIGRIDVLSAVPFMTQEEKDAVVTARQLNSIPLAVAEFATDSFRILFYNSAFEKTASGTEMFSLEFSQSMLNQPQPYYRLSDKIINLMDSVRSGGDGKLLLTFNEAYFEVKARCVAQARDRYCVLIRITNLTKDEQAENLSYLDSFVRRLYAMFERITLINLRENSIRPLYTSTQEDLLSGRQGIDELVREYAEKYIFPDDREGFLRLFDPQTLAAHFTETGCASFSAVFRSSVRHGSYAWMEYTVLKIDSVNYFLLIRNIHDIARDFIQNNVEAASDSHLYSPAHLWNNLLRSGLLRLFWKDSDRRFVGASKAFLDFYGFSGPEEIVGKNDEEVGWHVHSDRYMNDELEVINEGKTVQFIPGLCMSEGENREIMASKTPLYDENGEIKGLLGFFIDRELLTLNDKRGVETLRRDVLTGLLNSRGISEEAYVYRDEYYLRGVDFVRIHIGIRDFSTLNEQYGFDFGDKVLIAFGKALQDSFGLTSVIGRYAGDKFVVFRQVRNREEVRSLSAKVKAVGKSIRKINRVPVTLYLSVGCVLFSDCPDLEEQAKKCELLIL